MEKISLYYEYVLTGTFVLYVYEKLFWRHEYEPESKFEVNALEAHQLFTYSKRNLIDKRKHSATRMSDWLKWRCPRMRDVFEI